MIRTVNNSFPTLTGLCNGESVKEELNSYIRFRLILVFNRGILFLDAMGKYSQLPHLAEIMTFKQHD